MQAVAPRQGGRPPLITLDDVVAIGRDLGMRRLNLNAVAARLGVSATALYRHIEGRWELEQLVGESLLAELDLRDDPGADIERHLLSFALQLQGFTAERPGLASYLQVLFPRGDAGRRLLAAEVEALSRRGYSTDAAMVVSSGVATLAISLAARGGQHEGDRRGPGRRFRAGTGRGRRGLSDDPRLGGLGRVAAGLEFGVRAAVAGRLDPGAGCADSAGPPVR